MACFVAFQQTNLAIIIKIRQEMKLFIFGARGAGKSSLALVAIGKELKLPITAEEQPLQKSSTSNRMKQ
jgi:GTPase SAR1 family protein